MVAKAEDSAEQCNVQVNDMLILAVLSISS
jgi:hypothetical protein